MSREILFKAKRVDNDEWVEGFYYCKPTIDGFEHIIISYTEIERCNVSRTITYQTNYHIIIPETLCEFTGLCDKHGKRIWENDIVCSSEYKGVYCVFYGKHNISCCGCCYHSHQSVGFYISDTEDALTSAEEDEWGKWEVIGNRFDNAELLTAERIEDNEKI